MRYLADTHILIWAQNQPDRLPPRLAHLIGDPLHDVYFSPVSLWEIAIKFGLGKLDLLGHTPEHFADGVRESGMRCLTVMNQVYASSYRLPRRHNDPFDRLLFWQAIREGVTLLTVDPAAELYRQDGLVILR